MERIYSMNRSTLVRYETDGEYLNVVSNGQSILDKFSINPQKGEQNFIRVRDKQHNIIGKTDPEQIINKLNNNEEIEIQFSNFHFKERKITPLGSKLIIEDKLNGPQKSAIFAWDFPISEDFQVLKSESTYSLLKIADIIVEITYSQDMIAHQTEQGYRIKKRLNNTDPEVFIFELEFKAPTQIKRSSLEPETFKVQNQTIDYMFEENGHNTLDVILVPMPFTDIDFSNIAANDLQKHLYHVPYSNIIHERKTDKLYIFDNFKGKPTLFLEHYDITTKLIRKLVSKRRKSANVKVNLFGLDSSAVAARKMAEYDIFDSIKIINPLIELNEHYPNNKSFINIICNPSRFEEASSYMLENLVDDKVKYLVTPYERGYFGFIRAVECMGYVPKLNKKLSVIRSTSEQKNDRLFNQAIKKI